MEGNDGVASTPNKGKQDDANGNAKRSSRRDSNEGTTLSPLCTQESCCTKESEKNTIQCTTCNRRVHFRCTSLPLYQIAHFKTKGYRNFVCISCTVIPQTLKHIMPRPPLPEPTKEVSALNLTLTQKQVEVDALAETNRILSTRIKEMTTVISKQEEIIIKEGNDKIELQAKIGTLQSSLIIYEEKITNLENAIITKDSELDIARSVSDNTGNTNGSIAIHEVHQYMKKEIVDMGKSIKESLLKEIQDNNKMIEEKLSQRSELTGPWHMQREEGSSGNEATIQPAATVDFRTIIQEQQKQQTDEVNDQRSRARNIIIHGVQEVMDADKTEAKRKDEEFVTNLLRSMEIEDLAFKSVNRIGMKNPDKKRPLLLVMNSERDKDRIIQNLTKLKDQVNYKGVSVTEDYTVTERKLLNEWREKAKAKTAEEGEASKYIWRVRGTPKNGLSLKRFMKQRPAAQGI